MNAWQKWAKGAATATPPCQIRSQDVDWALIGGLTGSHYPAIKALYDRKAFTDEAWQNKEPTMQKLSADFWEEPTDSAQRLLWMRTALILMMTLRMIRVSEIFRGVFFCAHGQLTLSLMCWLAIKGRAMVHTQ